MQPSACFSVSRWTFSVPFSPISTSFPFHHGIFSDFFSRLSPIQPLIGSTGTHLRGFSPLEKGKAAKAEVLKISGLWRAASQLAGLPIPVFDANP